MSRAKLARFLSRHFNYEDSEENNTATIDSGELTLTIFNDVVSPEMVMPKRGVVS